MANSRGLFGLKIPAGGAIIPLEIFTDVRITNIAFGEEIEGNARSVVKIHRSQIRDDFDTESFEGDSLDGDEEDEDEDGGSDEDEDEEEEAEEGVGKAAPKLMNGINGKKASKLAAAAAAAAAASTSDDDEDEEDSAEVSGEDKDDSDSDSEDEDDIFVEDEYVICSLYPEKKEQAIVDLAFHVDEDIGFSVSGENDVEITGYYIAPDPLAGLSDSDYDEYDEDDGESLDSDELEAMYGEVEGDSDEVSDDDDEMDEDDIQIEELDEDVKTLPIKKVAVVAAKVNSKKRASEEEVEEVDDAVAEAAGDALGNLSKNQRKKLNKKLKTEAEAKDGKAEFAAKEDKPKAKVAEAKTAKKDTKEAKDSSAKKVTLPSGLIIEDKTIGTGPKAKAGNKVGMRYVGRLINGKQFDANSSGKPFMFKLGKGEVISGWDEGVKGMQVGGQRRLTCPPKLAYGKQGAPPDIPPNSTLVFDVKLVEIK